MTRETKEATAYNLTTHYKQTAAHDEQGDNRMSTLQPMFQCGAPLFFKERHFKTTNEDATNPKNTLEAGLWDFKDINEGCDAKKTSVFEIHNTKSSVKGIISNYNRNITFG